MIRLQSMTDAADRARDDGLGCVRGAMFGLPIAALMWTAILVVLMW